MQPQTGEWYWGAKCPQCGKLAAHTHDPMRGEGDTTKQSQNSDEARVMTCPNGHQLSVAARELVRFEWGAQ
jgi:hypothetical protein